MPNAALEEAIKEAYAACPSDEIPLDTLEVVDPSTGSSIYLVNDSVDHVLRLETGEDKTFIACGFQIILPAAGDNGAQTLDVILDNLDEVTAFVQSARIAGKKVPLKYRPYLASDPTQCQMNPPLSLFLQNVRVIDQQVQGQATFMDILNKKFPTDTYTRARFPGLAGG